MPVLGRRLVEAMTNRVRQTTHNREQRERLVALGRLSAGLAHELNHPASAILGKSGELKGLLGRLLRGPPPAEAGETAALLRQWLAGLEEKQPEPLSGLQAARREEELTRWLEARNVRDALGLAEIFAVRGTQSADLQDLASHLDGEALEPWLRWAANVIGARGLLDEIEEAGRRISELVQSVKIYSDMARAPQEQEADLHEGLDSTLTMLEYKLKINKVDVEKYYAPDLPRLRLNIGGMNQVWTHLIDNAADALPTGGRIRLSTSREGEFAVVRVEDSGPGIPAEIRDRVFEPFFTAKETGKGSGLGLGIAHRIVEAHGGSIRLDSRPGATAFTVRLPLRMPRKKG